MATKKQINANRQNGKKGGPKTVEGKVRSSQNATTHGLSARSQFLNTNWHAETLQEWEEFSGRMLISLSPQSALAEISAEVIIKAVWRLHRQHKLEEAVSSDTMSRLQYGDRLHDLILVNAQIATIRESLKTLGNEKKARRNPISAGIISPRMGKVACAVVSAILLGLYSLLGLLPFLLGAFCLALAFLYSWRVARLKSVPVADLISHGLSLAGLQFLCAYFVYDQGKPYSWLLFLSVVFISAYGELNNEARDIVVDKKAGIRHTADLIGMKWTKVLMVVAIAGAFAVIIYFIVAQIIPVWIFIVPAVLGPMLFAEKLWKLVRRESSFGEDREAFHDPALLIGAVTILAWFIADKIPLG